MPKEISFPFDANVTLVIPDNFVDERGEPYKWFVSYDNGVANREPKMRHLVSSMITSGVIDKRLNIIDSGAFIGDNALPWAKQINGIVYAIDPSFNNERLIHHIAALNSISNVCVLRHALSCSAKELQFNGSLDFNSFI